MLEKLAEYWLDSANERGYQSVFLQALLANGHRVIHSTRHSAIEYGKDVVTIDSNGTPCAFQLKGNPGTRLTLKQYRKIAGQLNELVNQPIVYPGVPKSKWHKSYLVTNGEIEEEVQRAIDDFNEGQDRAGFNDRKLEIISRGTLLKWVIDLGTSLWPSEVETSRPLVQLMAEDGKGEFEFQALHQLYISILALDDEKPTAPMPASQLKRRCTSAALITELALHSYRHKENHLAAINAWTMCCAYLIAACERQSKSFDRNASKIFEVSKTAAFEALGDLCLEMQSRTSHREGDYIADLPMYHFRSTLLIGLMSLYWFYCKDNERLAEHRAYIEEYVPHTLKETLPWGEGAVPQILIHYWYLRNMDVSPKPDSIPMTLLNVILSRNSSDDVTTQMASPYYRSEEVARVAYSELLKLHSEPFGGETFRNSSWFAEPLLHLLVRANWKQTCKLYWHNYTKFGHKHFAPASRWCYCLFKTVLGTESTSQPPLTKDWDQLVEEAKDSENRLAPEQFEKEPLVWLLFLITFPQRATPESIRFLGRSFDKTWY